jgi:hypothetical protein
MKANLLTMLFGCLGLVLGFVLCRAFFVPAPGQRQVTPSVPAQEERAVCTIVHPTFPPQVAGVHDPLKIAGEEIAHLKNQSTNR